MRVLERAGNGSRCEAPHMLSLQEPLRQLPVCQSHSVSALLSQGLALSFPFPLRHLLSPSPHPPSAPVLAPNPLLLSHLSLRLSCLNLSCLCLLVCTSSSFCLSALSPPSNTITKHRRCGLRQKHSKANFRE